MGAGPGAPPCGAGLPRELPGKPRARSALLQVSSCGEAGRGPPAPPKSGSVLRAEGAGAWGHQAVSATAAAVTGERPALASRAQWAGRAAGAGVGAPPGRRRPGTVGEAQAVAGERGSAHTGSCSPTRSPRAAGVAGCTPQTGFREVEQLARVTQLPSGGLTSPRPLTPNPARAPAPPPACPFGPVDRGFEGPQPSPQPAAAPTPHWLGRDAGRGSSRPAVQGGRRRGGRAGDPSVSVVSSPCPRAPGHRGRVGVAGGRAWSLGGWCTSEGPGGGGRLGAAEGALAQQPPGAT